MAAADLSCHTDKLPMKIRKVFYHFYLLKSEKEKSSRKFHFES